MRYNTGKLVINHNLWERQSIIFKLRGNYSILFRFARGSQIENISIISGGDNTTNNEGSHQQ